MKKFFRLITIVLLSGFVLVGCDRQPPRHIRHACQLLQERPHWRQDLKRVYDRWGTPPSLVLAIIYAESHFDPLARPKRKTVAGVPWFHRSTALGYAQALDGAWRLYLRVTNQLAADRTNFYDAADFIGWYTHYTRTHLGIPFKNAKAQYLAFHEGWGGYRHRTYRRYPSLIHLAAKVQFLQQRYHRQLRHCTTH